MIILGFLLICAGAGCYIYGDQINNDFAAQLESFLGDGKTNPGSIYVTLGIVVAIIGLLCIVVDLVLRAQKQQMSPNRIAIYNGRNVNCPHCNEELPEDSIFCSRCGAKVENLRICSNCGHTQSRQDVFCSKCGFEIKSQQSTQ